MCVRDTTDTVSIRSVDAIEDWNWVTGARSVKPMENVAAELADQGIHCDGDGDDDERSVVG